MKRVFWRLFDGRTISRTHLARTTKDGTVASKTVCGKDIPIDSAKVTARTSMMCCRCATVLRERRREARRIRLANEYNAQAQEG